jgi:hypothetical protein
MRRRAARSVSEKQQTDKQPSTQAYSQLLSFYPRQRWFLWLTLSLLPPSPCLLFLLSSFLVRSGEKFGIKGIPALIIVGKDGKIITQDGRTPVSKEKDAVFVQWAG